MPRRPKDPADAFSHNDLAIASAGTKRSVQMMADSGLLPGDGGIRDLKRICVIGALVSAGAPLFVAGRVVDKLLWSLNQPDGELPSGLVDFDHKLGSAAFPIDRPINDYWRHRAALSRPDLYRPGEAWSRDYRVEIADREHVFTSGGIIHPTKRDYEGRIDGWERGSDVSFQSIAETSAAPAFQSDADTLKFLQEQEQLQEASQAFLKNAVGLLSINASLAIRNGLDRLADHRAGRIAR
jgi:hypothetical protein